ncbi:MAG: methyltransferase [Treponema sp.]|jgi:23S rRNA (uracil1939-C5)-methyltransferase|nr:methyltransferase [Treponema sp.]
MVIGDIFTLPVERIASSGAGVLHIEGEAVFMERSAPGDLVSGRIVVKHKTWSEAEILDIIDPSPLRAVPPCPLFGRCGGCSLQHLSYQAQIDEKTAILKDAFLRIGGFPLPVEPTVHGGEPFEYRNRIQLHGIAPVYGIPQTSGVRKRRASLPAFRTGRAQSCLGFKAKKSSELIPVSDCPVADKRIRRALLHGEIVPPAFQDRFTVYGRGELLLVEGSPAAWTPAKGRMPLFGRDISLDASVFFQSNAAMLEVLLADILQTADRADSNSVAADLYCGVGTFALFLSDRFPSFDLAEENGNALALARENLKDAQVSYYALRDEQWPRFLRGKHYGFMVMDPPRQGLSAALRSWLCREGSPLFAYVSCDPASLARDSRELLSAYRLQNLSWYDFYPQTPRIESLAVFERGKG